MNWTNFLLILTLLYLTYFGINLFYDFIRARKPPKDGSSEDMLFFDDDIIPQLILPKELSSERFDELPDQLVDNLTAVELPETKDWQQQASLNPIHSTGGVRMQELFGLAKNKLIQYTEALSY